MQSPEHPAQGAGDLLSHLPYEILHAELLRRQDEQQRPPKPSCGTSGKRGGYNMSAHVFALFLILTLSTLACSFPIIARRFPKLPIPHRFLFLSRHFGTGVLIATAFIHLLPTAFVSLTDPCLPDFWNRDYPPMAGAIAMLAVFVVVLIEMFFATRGAGHSHETEWTKVPDDEGGLSTAAQQGGHTPLLNSDEPISNGHLSIPRNPQPAATSSEDYSPRYDQPITPTSDDDNDDNESDLELTDLDPLPTSESHRYSTSSHSHHHKHSKNNSLSRQNSQPQTDPRDPHKLLLQCLLLEAGILFHSIFIGMSLSVSTGTPFLVLLVAISFHQTFEGLALGSRISALIPSLFPASSPRPWLMALAYGATTPIGQAIGIWMHGLYDPASEVGLLMVGITNAVSSGLLLFAGLVQLMAEDFLSERSYETLKGRRRWEACGAVGLGGVLMAVVGAFA